MDLDAELAALFDNFRFIQTDFFLRRSNDPVSLHFNACESILYGAQFPAHGGKFFDHGDQLIFTPDIRTGKFAQHFIIKAVLIPDLYPDLPGIRLNLFHGHPAYIFTAVFRRRSGGAPDIADPLHKSPDLIQQILFDPVIPGKHLHPFRNIELHLCNRKLIKNLLHDLMDVLRIHLFAVDRNGPDAVLLLQFSRQRLRFIRIRLFTVQQDHKRLPDGFQFPHGLFFRLYVAFSRDICNAAVRGNHEPDRRVLPDHLLRSDLRRPGEGNLVFIPRGSDLPFPAVLHMPGRPLDHKSHTVNQSDFCLRIIGKLYHSRFFRYEFRLCRHDRRTGRGLGHFIPGPLFRMTVRHVRKHKKINKPFNECGFPGPYRPYNANVNLPTRARLDISVYLK